jgi:hypothetical protein
MSYPTTKPRERAGVAEQMCREVSCLPDSCEQFCVAGCESVFRSVYKLEEHARRHTQEKLVGCPTCGGLFANKVKFLDHCMRQVPVECEFQTC